MGKKILIVGDIPLALMEAARLAMKKEHSNEVVIVDLEEAKQKALMREDFENLPTMIKASPVVELAMAPGSEKSGKELRRQRRARERKAKKKGK